MKSVANTKIFGLIALAALTAFTTGCANTGAGRHDVASADQQIYDPFENANRSIFSVNESIDKAVIEPVARGYRYITPKPVRNGVRNVLRNLKSPLTMGNKLLQGDLGGFANASGRLFINTILGVGGIFDIADQGGIAYEPEDFGQTLAVWGVGHGPYIVLPILGPSSARDGTGLVVDGLLDPVRIYMFSHDLEWLHYTRIGVSAIDQREELLDVIDDLRRHSFDYYAALRSAYYQRRQALVNNMDPDMSAGPDIPDYGNGSN